MSESSKENSKSVSKHCLAKSSLSPVGKRKSLVNIDHQMAGVIIYPKFNSVTVLMIVNCVNYSGLSNKRGGCNKMCSTFIRYK